MTYAEQQQKHYRQEVSGLAADRLEGAAAMAETMIQEIDAEGNPLEVPLREDPAWGDLQPFDPSSGACCCSKFGSLAGKCILLVESSLQARRTISGCLLQAPSPEA